MKYKFLTALALRYPWVRNIFGIDKGKS